MQMAFLDVKCSSFRDVAAVVIVWEVVDIDIAVMEWCAGFPLCTYAAPREGRLTLGWTKKVMSYSGSLAWRGER